MTDTLCRKCDYEIFNDKDELNYYLATLNKRYDRALSYKYTINDVNLDNIIEVFDYYINIHNNNIDYYFINCLIQINFNNNTIINMEIINC